MFGRGFSICGVYYSSVAGTTTFLFFIMLYAIGDAINSEDNVPITTPRIIANAKLRIESPPRMKIYSNTVTVLIDRVTDSCQDSTNKCLVDFQREWQDTPEQ